MLSASARVRSVARTSLASVPAYLRTSRYVAASATKDPTPAEVQALTAKGRRYLDVRTVEEYSAGHVPKSINVPFMNKALLGMAPNPAFLQAATAAFPNKGEAILVGCKSGARAGNAILQLKAAGYEDLVNAGGFDAWLAAGLPVEK